MGEEEEIPSYFWLCLSIRRCVPHFTDDYRFEDAIKVAASLDVTLRDMWEAIFLLDISYDDFEIVGATVVNAAELHHLKTFVITYTLDNVDVRVHAYRERAYHLVNHIFGIRYPIDQEERRKHADIVEKGYIGAINWWLESHGKEVVREALKCFDKRGPISRSLGRRNHFIHRLSDRSLIDKESTLLDDMKRYVAWLRAGLEEEGEERDDIEGRIQDVLNEDRSEKVDELRRMVKTELKCVLDAIGEFDRSLRRAILGSIPG